MLLFSSFDLSFVKNYFDKYAFLIFDICTMSPYFYAVLCLYFALFKVKVKGAFGFYAGHNTVSTSFCFYASHIARFSAPLSFNYMQILDIKEAAFSTIMGKVNLVPVFGTTFPTFFPVLLVFICAMNFFNVYNKIFDYLGINMFKYEEGYTSSNCEEGRKIILKN